MLLDRLTCRWGHALGYLFCELAFKTDCRGPFQYSYRLGCWLYGHATDAGIRCGELVQNPAFGSGTDEPLYVPRSPHQRAPQQP
ncbi:MAG: hypothetical protein WBF58_21585 [Xanthobacteraceae bacterium]